MKEKIRLWSELGLSIIFITSVIMGYYKDVSYMSEYCFLSGLTVGVVFLISFIYGVKEKKKLPIWIYFCCTVNIDIIFIATIAIRLGVEGAFIFIHIINPILVFIYWILFCNHLEKDKPIMVLSDCIFPIGYFVFASLLYKITNHCPFPAKLILVDNSLWKICLEIVGCLIIFVLLGYVFYYLNRLIHKKLL